MINETSQELNIELEDNIAEGEYSNLVIINHSSSEFVIDFVKVMPGVPKAKVKSRIILSPEHTKRLYLSLQDNISRYETMIGHINIPNKASDESQITVGFSTGEA